MKEELIIDVIIWSIATFAAVVSMSFSYVEDEMRFGAEDVVFWIFLLGALGIIVWMLQGSPMLAETLLSLTVLIIGSEFLLWRKYYEVDKNTALSFSKFKNDLENIQQGQREIKELIKRGA